MSVALLRLRLVLLAPALAGAAGAVAAASLPTSPAPALALLALALLALLVVWPWAALPVVVLGGAFAAQLLGLSRVTPIVAVHVSLLALAFAALALRRTLDPRFGGRAATAADLPMLALTTAIVLGAAAGLARGNPAHAVLVATYELAVIPAYFFLTTLTLGSAHRLRAAARLYLIGAAGLALAGFASPGRHGGLFSALALLPLLAGGSTAARPLHQFALGSLFAIDVVFAAFRSVWLAVGLALIVLVWRGSGQARRTAVTALLLAALTASVALAAGGLHGRAAAVASELHQSSGYRVPEARIGLHAFAANPLLGEGLGQVSRQVAVPGFGIVDVGPVYHAFYMTVLANGGLVGLALVLWPLLLALRRSGRLRDDMAVALRALLVGFLAAAAFAGPTDGHWELGLLPALLLIAPGRLTPEEHRR